MKVRAWTCGIMAALIGCTSLDRGFEPSRGSKSETGKVPPGAPATWQQGSMVGTYHVPTDPHPVPPPGSPGATQLPAPGAAASALPPGTPNLDLNPPNPPSTALAAGGSPIHRTTYEEQLPPALRVVELPVAGSAHDALLSDLAGTEAGNRRRVMRPPNTETGDGSDSSPAAAAKSPSALPEAILMAAPEPKQPKETKGSADATPRTDKQDEPPLGRGLETPPQRGPASPAFRTVNTKRIVLNYHVKDVGPSGLSGVELWYTRDAQVWQKDEGRGRAGPPYIFEAPEAGMYGFTLVAKSGLGLGKKPPQRGDTPQVWVEVALTKPAVRLLAVTHGVGAKARAITITWSIAECNLAHRPITLAYAESAEGPWMPLAANLENTGCYVWNMPASAPASFFVRVEAADLLGNVGSAQSTKPIVLDLSQPEVQLDGVDASAK